MNWSPNPDEKSINLIIIGSDGLAGDLVNEIRVSHHQQMISIVLVFLWAQRILQLLDHIKQIINLPIELE